MRRLDTTMLGAARVEIRKTSLSLFRRRWSFELYSCANQDIFHTIHSAQLPTARRECFNGLQIQSTYTTVRNGCNNSEKSPWNNELNWNFQRQIYKPEPVLRSSEHFHYNLFVTTQLVLTEAFFFCLKQMTRWGGRNEMRWDCLTSPFSVVVNIKSE